LANGKNIFLKWQILYFVLFCFGSRVNTRVASNPMRNPSQEIPGAMTQLPIHPLCLDTRTPKARAYSLLMSGWKSANRWWFNPLKGAYY
jgi:hypothetical protein